MRQTFKILFAITFLLGLAGASSRPAYALDCTNNPTTTVPSITEIVCPVARVINIFLLSSGAILIIMILIGGVKLAMAHGDPKGMQAASGTWTWAIIGFFVIVGSMTILTLVGKLIGWEYKDPLTSIQEALKEFYLLVTVKK